MYYIRAGYGNARFEFGCVPYPVRNEMGEVECLFPSAAHSKYS